MGKHDKTLAAIFDDPVRSNMKWRKIEALLSWLGAVIEEAEGSRVSIELNGVVATFHRPHPSPDANRGTVVAVRKFLTSAGVAP